MEDLLTKMDRELKTGVLALLVLRVIGSSQEPVHGYRIIQLIKQHTERQGIEVKEGTVYAVCRSLQGLGLITNEIVDSDQGPPRKVFRITPTGRRALRQGLEKWRALVAAVDDVTGDMGDR